MAVVTFQLQAKFKGTETSVNNSIAKDYKHHNSLSL